MDELHFDDPTTQELAAEQLKTNHVAAIVLRHPVTGKFTMQVFVTDDRADLRELARVLAEGSRQLAGAAGTAKVRPHPPQ